jgi:hypothetical protein
MLEIFISKFIEKHLEVRSIVKRRILKHGGRIANHGFQNQLPKSP